MLNQTRIGRYEVVAALGQGAMGAVYKATDPVIERTVAIKTINLGVKLSNQERVEFEARFYREAKSAGRLNHPDIVTIYDVGETDDIAYIAMEHLEGETLREILDSGVVLPIEMIGSIAARIANALHYAHEHGVVHRDVKPANIMVTSGRAIKIMDFGIAQMPTGSRTQLGTILGSPKYMAPEQVAGQPTDRRTDIFALGVVLYEMLTGATPFNGDNLSAIMYKVLNEEPAPPSAVNPRVPPAFDRVIARALAKRPEDRYQTAQAFAQDLADYDAVLPVGGRTAGASIRPAASQPAEGKEADGDATVFLPPRAAAGAPKPAAGGSRVAAFLSSTPYARKPALLAIPLLIVAVFMIYLQGTQPKLGPASPGLEGASGDTRKAPAAAKGEQSKTAAKPAKATLTFGVAPWGEVYVDGKKVGVSPPLTRLQLTAGRHKLEIRNRGFAPYRRTVNLKSGQSLKIRHKFE